MNSWYYISGTELLIILGICVLWILAALFLFITIGTKKGPTGGIDSIANAIIYALIWRIIIYVLPGIVLCISIFLWLWQNHRQAFYWAVATIVLCIFLLIVYKRYLKKFVYTPEYTAPKTESFEKWKKRQAVYKTGVNYTESDLICEYANQLVSNAVAIFSGFYPPEDIEKKLSYINTFMETRYRELPHMESWDYIPDIRDMIPPRSDGSDRFLLEHSDFCLVAKHYGKTLRTDHWYDRYEFKRSFIAEWYSWLPMMALIYDDGTMDLIIVC